MTVRAYSWHSSVRAGLRRCCSIRMAFFRHARMATRAHVCMSVCVRIVRARHLGKNVAKFQFEVVFHEVTNVNTDVSHALHCTSADSSQRARRCRGTEKHHTHRSTPPLEFFRRLNITVLASAEARSSQTRHASSPLSTRRAALSDKCKGTQQSKIHR